MFSYECLVLALMLNLAVQASKVADIQDLNFEPKIAIECGKVARHVDVNTGVWTDDASKQAFCSSDSSEILKFCKKTYPGIRVTNIVEGNENVTICSGEDCKSSYSVVPYRCLVGTFEADALSYPFDADCNFGYVHESQTCKSHTYWKDTAKKICRGKAKRLEKYGILVPCGTNVFTGVEYVCCKKSVTGAPEPTKESFPSPESMSVEEVRLREPKTEQEILVDLLNKFAAHIPKESKGCDRSIYAAKTDVLREEKNKKVKDLAKNLNEAKSRMDELKKDDPDQAKSFFKKSLEIFQDTLKNIENQAKLDESRLSQAKKECAQMNLNHKKHLAMTAFLDSVRQHQDKPSKMIKAFHRFLRVLENDQDQNMRSVAKKMLGKHKAKIMAARDQFMSHLTVVKSAMKEGVEILRKLRQVHGKIEFDLPPFATDIDFEFAHKPKTSPTPPNTATPTTASPNTASSATTFITTTSPAKTLGLNSDEKTPENEHKQDHPLKSRAVFAAVIGLSCGALVIMIVIVLALFFRKGSYKRSTKTVIADDDSQEKRHLLKMQEAGFENPTYKFFAN